MSPELRAKLSNVTNLPSPPAVAGHVIDLAHQPEVSLNDMAEAITCDASLSSKVLRIANSPLYAQRRQISNLRQALVVLGLNATVTLALSFSLLPLLKRSPDQNKHLAHSWRRCLLSAMSARALADKLQHVNSEEAFLAALLQDIGLMAIDHVVPNFYLACEDFYDNHEKLRAYEIEQLDADHADVGAWLLDQWRLPERLRQAVSMSHTLENDDSNEPHQSLSRCVAVSGLIADIWMADPDQTQPNELGVAHLKDLVSNTLGIDREGFSSVLREIGKNIPEVARMFETELIDDIHAQLVIERAEEVLCLRNLRAMQEVDEVRKKAQELTSLASDLQQETQRDSLTKVASRGYLDELLEKGFSNANRFGWTLSVAFVDLDHFKKVNDTYGHVVGDEVLCNVASTIAHQLRGADTVGRYGGEEFVLILPGADAAGVRIVCDRVLLALRKLEHDIGTGDKIVVTASIGCATLTTCDEFASSKEFVAAADEAAYKAKDLGRDRLVQYGVTPSPSPQLVKRA